MAQSAYKDKIITTGTGASDSIFLTEKENGQDWTLIISASSWGSADLQASGDGTNWANVKDYAGTTVNFAANSATRVPGNLTYRLNVSSHAAAMTLLAK